MFLFLKVTHIPNHLLLSLTHHSLKFVKWQSPMLGGDTSRKQGKCGFCSQLLTNWGVSMHSPLTTLASMSPVPRERGDSAGHLGHCGLPKSVMWAHDRLHLFQTGERWLSRTLTSGWMGDRGPLRLGRMPSAEAEEALPDHRASKPRAGCAPGPSTGPWPKGPG